MRMQRKECISMLLAGGQGSRLYCLTEKTAKPAVPFGGKYRIIDFSISNCVNSGIDTIGILTQYQPLELNEYIGNGAPWGLNKNFGGAHVLPPYTKADGNEWYKGTANAIYQNIPFVDIYDPEYVVILSGDHIYKMDYSKMIEYHKIKKADCTIAVMEVPMSEASRMGIMSADKSGRITEFEEKPKVPKSNTASMGVYVFTWSTLKAYLIADEADKNSSNDFGKNIIPNMLNDGKGMYAYKFKGYWKDVGTLDSLWKANMDLIDPSDPINLKDSSTKIYSRNYAHPSTAIYDKASIKNSIIAEGCEINGEIVNCIVYTGCTIKKGAKISNSVIMPNTIINSSADIKYSIIGESCEIGEGAKIGEEQNPDSPKITVIGHEKTIDSKAIIPAGQII